MKDWYDIVKESFIFSLNVIDFYKHLIQNEKEYVLSKQLLRSGTSIWANIKEAQFGVSKKDFLHKMYTALKEANETEYRLALMKESNIGNSYQEFEELYGKSREILWTLVKIVKTTKSNLYKTSNKG